MIEDINFRWVKTRYELDISEQIGNPDANIPIYHERTVFQYRIAAKQNIAGATILKWTDWITIRTEYDEPKENDDESGKSP